MKIDSGIHPFKPAGSPLPTHTFWDIDRTGLHGLIYPENGPTAHFLHANGMCAGTYQPFFNHLQGGLHLTASDLPGHGQSGSAATDPIVSWQSFVPDLRNLMINHMSPPLYLIGHSLGAVIAYLTAARYPELFKGLVMIDPVIFPRRRLFIIKLLRRLGLMAHFPIAKAARRRKRRFASKEDAARRFLSGKGMFRTWDKPFIKAYLECAIDFSGKEGRLRCHPETEAQIFTSVPVDVWSFASKIKCPVLLLRGQDSDTFVPDAAQRLAKSITDCRLHTIPETTHFLPMEKPALCAAPILTFIG